MKILRVPLPLGVALMAVALLGIWLSAHDKDPWPVPEEAKKRTNPIPASEAGFSAARDLYKDKCAQCHGETGKGDGAEAKMYSVKSADFTNAEMMSKMTDGEIFYKITEGRRPMPSFKKRLTEEQRWQLVNFLRSFSPTLARPGKK